MKKNKGFTVVELIASFALTMVIAAFLFEVLIDVKDVFAETTIKTNIQEKMGIISKNIKNVLPPIGSKVIGAGTSWQISNNKNGNLNSGIGLSYDESSVTINNQKFSMPDLVNIDMSKSSITNNCPSDCFLKVHFELTSSNLSKPYIYDVVYYYSKY
ncbi:MAG: prepilin-type N-terminal cleavage/methylation domain-containing protein [Bacilli bacterium]|nr:prepilin-type N-terminal cleavage/methylation domain-containing protein [Bacilli bacterium]